jgi:hypothetical protein
MRFVAALLALLLLAGPAAPQGRVSTDTVHMVMARTIEDVVRPGYAAFADSVGKLEKGMAELCARPSASAYGTVRDVFAEAVAAWSGIDFIRFGPAAAANRLERVQYWPDRKSIGLKQVQEILATRDPSAADAASLAGKSVAVQGLGALEFVLFGTGSEALASSGDPFRCRYGQAIAVNLATIASELQAGWADGSAASTKWTVGRDPEAAAATLNELLSTVIHGLEAVRDVRLRGFLDVASGKDRPKLAIFWRSCQTIASIRANIAGLARMFDESAMIALLPEGETGIADSIRFEFNELDGLLSGLGGPIDKLLSDDASRDRLVVADLVIKSLVERFDTQFAPAAGLSAGFSFSDGD